MSKGSSRTRSAGSPVALRVDAEARRHLRALGLPDPDAYRAWCRQHGLRDALHKSWQERRAELALARKSTDAAAHTAELAAHLATLGLGSFDEYEAWCRERGLSATARKGREQRKRELEILSRERAEQAMVQAQRHARRPDAVLRALHDGESLPESARNPSLRRIEAAFASETGPDARAAYLRLLLVAQEQAPELLQADHALASLGPQPGNDFPAALLALARRHAEWVREPEAWRPPDRSARKRFASLARHVLAQYPVPAFMDSAWFLGSDAGARRRQGWFCHIARGENLRTADLPIVLSRMAAHHLLEAPADLSIEAALRWGQVLALGGSEHLARAVIASRLGEELDHDGFWTSVLHFFVNNPMLDQAHIGPIVDYIHHVRFVPRGPDATGDDAGPLEPSFAMKGRTVRALLRRVEEWHRGLRREQKKGPVAWPSCGLAGYECADSQPLSGRVRWTITEVLSAQELREEGKAMSHCVATYDRSCAAGIKSVWSLSLHFERSGTRRRVMTIAVANKRRCITEARGRCNRLPGQKHASVRLDDAPRH
jgi:hypothetical protein